MQLANVTTYHALQLATDRARSARDRALRWLLAHVDSNGRPIDADVKNGWGRVPWALASSGELEAAASVVGWAESTSQFGDDGNFVEGPLRPAMLPSYPLSHYAIGCWMVGATGPALRTMNAVREMQDTTGGIPLAPGPDNPFFDLLQTAQAGAAALFTGQQDVADAAYRWIANCVAQQPELDQGRLYPLCTGEKLVTDFPDGLAFLALTDFSQPKQTYFNPGMAAVFLSSYSQAREEPGAMALAEKLLELNLKGSDEHQFHDRDSVQICKFGWGVAAMQLAQPDGPWLEHVVRMAHWFADWQEVDGSWAPARFMSPTPDDVDKTVKTAEHIVEVNAILTALGRADSVAP